ncbi:MAG: hypothetical protein AAGH65_09680 [Pseudomonadota bacterium]
MDIILLELLLVLGVTLGIGIWQLIDVNKALKEHESDHGNGDNESDSNDDKNAAGDRQDRPAP